MVAVDVRYWPKADIFNERVNVCYRGKSGHFRHQSGHQLRQVANCGFMSALGVKRTWVGALQMSAFDPKRTFRHPFPNAYLSRYDALS
jgi:hypothetical protein